MPFLQFQKQLKFAIIVSENNVYETDELGLLWTTFGGGLEVVGRW